jgi:Alpha-mannosidase
VDSVVLWLPDTFGYSAALPQILKGCGVKYLVTQKIFWSYNEGDKFPYHYFTWEGADGSKIDTFLPTSYTYPTTPTAICETWNGRVQKRGLDAFMLPYGYGDGGGGPSRDFIEYLEREKDLEGMPKVEMQSPVKFFEDMEAEGGPQHTYVGELYFSAHRGVFTTQGAIKRGNRKAELALREAEMWGTLAMLRGAEYPLRAMDASWKLLLLNQFHDILPGSSIGVVYEKARKEHAQIIADAGNVTADALSVLCKGDGVTVLNSLSFARTGIVTLPDSFRDGAVTTEGDEISVSATADGVLALITVPACGSVSLKPDKNDALPETVTAMLTDNGGILENSLVRAELNSHGEIVSFVDKETGREFAAGPMNRLLMYKDVPRLFDAWDIDSHYEIQPVDINEPVQLTLKESNGLRAIIHMERKILNSTFAQDIVLEAGARRIEFRTTVDWHELHRLLKVGFPADVKTTEAIQEIQFGYVTHPTHRSRLYDSDRFEVCNQRYSALCDGSHGIAVLNDCKYGISNNGNELRLTLLRGAATPEMRADNGLHTFTYALTAWEGSFSDCDVVKQAYELNVPMTVTAGNAEPMSAFAVSAENVFIDTVKPAEDGSGDVIVRMYEAKKSDTFCKLGLNIPAAKICLSDMMENVTEELTVKDGCVKLHFGPFEVKTLRISVKG